MNTQSQIFQAIAKRDRRDWSTLPADFELNAVRAAFEDVKGLLPKSAVRERIKASRATSFNELRAALSNFQFLSL